jgi:hypothetical protein
VERNQTRSAAEFVAAMAKVFVGRGGDVLERITHQSFDVRLYSYPCLFRSFIIVFQKEDRRWS